MQDGGGKTSRVTRLSIDDKTRTGACRLLLCDRRCL